MPSMSLGDQRSPKRFTHHAPMKPLMDASGRGLSPLSAAAWSVPDDQEDQPVAEDRAAPSWRHQAMEQLSMLERMARLESLAKVVEHKRKESELQRQRLFTEWRQRQLQIAALNIEPDLKQAVVEFLWGCKELEELSLIAQA